MKSEESVGAVEDCVSKCRLQSVRFSGGVACRYQVAVPPSTVSVPVPLSHTVCAGTCWA